MLQIIQQRCAIGLMALSDDAQGGEDAADDTATFDLELCVKVGAGTAASKFGFEHQAT
jgi:hypothetical protein